MARMKHVYAGLLMLGMLVPLVGNAAEDGKLAFLWCRPGFDRGTVERRVEDANFSVRLVSYWDEKPTVKSFDSRFGIEKQMQCRFMGSGKTQWLSVEYMRLDTETPVAKDITTWVKAGIMLTGRVSLMEPDGVDFKMLSLAQVPRSDAAFLAKHKADMMCSHIGTLKIGDAYHRFFIVCLNRGRESWKVVKVFPVHPPKGCTEKEACKVSPSDLMIAGLFIGNFKVLSSDKLPAFPNVPDRPMTPARALGEHLLSAVNEGDLARVRVCLSQGADANFRGARGLTPLGASIGDLKTGPNPAVVALLLEKGADPKALWGDCGTTPLFSLVQNSTFRKAGSAVLSNQVAAVKLMLKYGADPDKEQGLFRKSPLGYAVMRNGDMELVKALVEGGAAITDKIVESAKNSEIKQYLIQHQKGTNK